MAKQSLNTLKNWFKKGLKPLESQFADWLDSFYHRDATDIPMSSIQGLTNALNSFVSSDTIEALNLAKENKDEKGTANGYAPLGADGKVPEEHLPPIASDLNSVLEVGNDAGGQNIVNLADPVGAQDADTKAAREAGDESVINQLLDGADEDDNTLKKLAVKINAIHTLLTSDDVDLDTIQEIVDYIKEHESDINSLLSGKVNITDVYNALDQVLAGKVLDARQGKVLKDLIDALSAAIALKAPLTSPALTGTPTAPTAALGTKTQQLATTEFVQDENGKVVTANISGSVTIDLSTGRVFILTLTGNVTNFNFSNEVVGKAYTFIFKKDTTEKTISWTAGRYEYQNEIPPVLTTYALNGKTYSKDIITALCSSAGRLDLFEAPNWIPN
ncbi:hypothetical protein [Chryseosolibacter indicus]|uniref:Ig-like domain-containing protein n=1 Tax=Chryseosolibacter indicus TaxID=2782351 RepID=A0ABS5VNF1_9BACT|nr:hypothetical protein [Chryseosolibacter indicus]MBT1702969.1 hypothetical protein [Chryseosolibacter indicus]